MERWSRSLTAPWAVFADALSFLGSGLFVLRIRKVEDAVEVATVDGRKVEPVDRV